MLSAIERRFIERQRAGHLATASTTAMPHVVPVCYAVTESTIYIAIDQKPKNGDPRALKRLRNILENPEVTLVIDRYDEDWSQLAWVMIRGHADILESGPATETPHQHLKARYPQYREMNLTGLPVIAIHIEHVASWGKLA